MYKAGKRPEGWVRQSGLAYGPGSSLDFVLRATGSPDRVSRRVVSSNLEFGRVTLRLHLEERLGEQGADGPTRKEIRTYVSVPL